MTKLMFSKLLWSGFFVSWVMMIFAISYHAESFIQYQPSFPYYNTLLTSFNLPQWLYSFANFDGVHYLTIVQQGYIGTGLIQAFFPVYPGVTWLLSFIIPNQLLAGLVISLSMVLLWVMIGREWLSEIFSTKVATWSMVAWLLFPTSFFLVSMYTESLFLVLVVLCLWLGYRRQWMLAGVVAAVASGTRVTGLALVPALMIEWWLGNSKQLIADRFYFDLSKPLSSILHTIIFLQSIEYQKLLKILFNNPSFLFGLAIAPLGLVFYSFFLWIEFRDPIYFYTVQEQFNVGRQSELVLLPQVFWRYLKIAFSYSGWSWVWYTAMLELFLTLIGLLSLLYATLKLRFSWVVFGWIAFLLPTLSGTLTSMPRYVLTIPIMFVVFGELLARYPVLRLIFLPVSCAWLVLNTILFIQGVFVG